VGVSMKPGATVLTLMRLGRSSAASTCAEARTAAFEAM
jgi:hypothetical protein